MKLKVILIVLVSFGIILCVLIGLPLIGIAQGKQPTDTLVTSLAHGTATPESVKALLAAGADPTWVQSLTGQTLLYITVLEIKESVAPEICQILINAGADVNAATMKGETPLSATKAGCKTEVAKVLLANNANPNPPGVDVMETPLVGAVVLCCPEITELLIQAGATIPKEITDEEGQSFTLLKQAENCEHFPGTPAFEALKRASTSAPDSSG